MNGAGLTLRHVKKHYAYYTGNVQQPIEGLMTSRQHINNSGQCISDSQGVIIDPHLTVSGHLPSTGPLPPFTLTNSCLLNFFILLVL